MTQNREIDPDPVLSVQGVSKTFTLHLQGALRLPVVNGLTFDVRRGSCVVLGESPDRARAR